MLLWRVVPCDVMKVVSNCGVTEAIGIANDSVEITLGGGDEVDVIHEDGSREVFPTPDAILKEGP